MFSRCRVHDLPEKTVRCTCLPSRSNMRTSASVSSRTTLNENWLSTGFFRGASKKRILINNATENANLPFRGASKKRILINRMQITGIPQKSRKIWLN